MLLCLAGADAVAAALLGAEGEQQLREQTLAEIAAPHATDLLRWGLDGRQLPVVAAHSVLEWLADARPRSRLARPSGAPCRQI